MTETTNPQTAPPRAAKPLAIGILGAGNIGRPLGRHWVAAGHRVTFGSRDPGRLVPFVEPLGDRARAATYAEAVEASDVVLLSVPHPALDELLDRLAPRLAGKTVIDATSPIGVSEDGLFVSLLGPGTTRGSRTAERLPDASVARAFTHFPDELLWSRGTQQRHFWGMGIASDDPGAREVTQGLVHDAGFVPVHLGGLKESAALDPGGVLFGYVSTPAGLRAAAAL
ncbi:NAD(P)-binding domain-containing protein [Streptomyces sp. NBC_00597]|uniref:NADPH-dependent F420 reductase n=1 Tax=unclassified Streptomyces TaxID=2593676 RepID=UPI002E136520|nr:NAD(P)-binding domain-containing protein [Streptomyces sp. NBC_01205]